MTRRLYTTAQLAAYYGVSRQRIEQIAAARKVKPAHAAPRLWSAAQAVKLRPESYKPAKGADAADGRRSDD